MEGRRLRLNKNCEYLEAPSLEALFAAESLLSGAESTKELLTEVYGKKLPAELRSRYRFLAEALEAARMVGGMGGLWLLEFLLDLAPEEMQRDKLMQHCLSRSEEERIYRMEEWSFHRISKAEIRKALRDDAQLSRLYETVRLHAQEYAPEHAGASFLAFAAFLRENRRVVQEFFALAGELDNEKLRQYMDKYRAEADALCRALQEALAERDGLEVSQMFMGKTFKNRGPYESFYFLPVLMFHRSAVRFFDTKKTAHKRQILFLSLRRKKEQSEDDTVQRLRVLADSSRYRILKLLAGSEPLRGQDIAKALQIAPSTVTHHMEQLKSAGLVTEEPAGNAKYFGIGTDGIQSLIEAVRRDFPSG